MNGVSFVSYICSQLSLPSSINLTILYSPLGKLPTFSCPKIDWLSKFFYGLNIFACMLCLVHWLDECILGFTSSIDQTKTPQVHFSLSLLRKALQTLHPCVQRITCLGLLVFLWINSNENNMKIRNSHNIMYIT